MSQPEPRSGTVYKHRNHFGEKRDSVNHRRKAVIHGSGWMHAAMWSETRVLPDDTTAGATCTNDFHCGHRGAARSIRGAKAHLRHAERRSEKGHIERSIADNED